MRVSLLTSLIILLVVEEAWATEYGFTTTFKIRRSGRGRGASAVEDEVMQIRSADDPMSSVNLGEVDLDTILGPVDPDSGFRVSVPGAARFKGVTFTRSLTMNDVFKPPSTWRRWWEETAACLTSEDCRQWKGSSVAMKQNIYVEIFQMTNNVKTVLLSVKLHNAWPTSHQVSSVSPPTRRASGNEVSIETIEIAHEGIEFLQVHVDDVGASEGVAVESCRNVEIQDPALNVGVGNVEEQFWLGGKRLRMSSISGGKSSMATSYQSLQDLSHATISPVGVPVRARVGVPARSVTNINSAHESRLFQSCGSGEDQDCDLVVSSDVGDEIPVWPSDGADEKGGAGLGFFKKTHKIVTDITVSTDTGSAGAAVKDWLSDILTPWPTFPKTQAKPLMGALLEVLDRCIAAQDPAVAPSVDSFFDIFTEMFTSRDIVAQEAADYRSSRKILKTPLTDLDLRLDPTVLNTNTFSVDSFFDIWYEYSPTSDGALCRTNTNTMWNISMSKSYFRPEVDDEVIVCSAFAPARCWDGSCKTCSTHCPVPTTQKEWEKWGHHSFMEVMQGVSDGRFATHRARRVLRYRIDQILCNGESTVYDSFITHVTFPKVDAADTIDLLSKLNLDITLRVNKAEVVDAAAAAR